MQNRNDEFFTGEEFRGQTEYKFMRAEQYINASEVGARAPEAQETAPETQFGNEQGKPRQKPSEALSTKSGKRRASVKDFLTKITESATSTVGTTVAAVGVVATVAVCGSLYVPPPKVNLLSLDVGADYVSYVVQIDELQENVDYDIVVENAYHTFTQEDVSAGENVNFINQLKPFYEYTLSVVGKTEDAIGETVYFEEKFYTGTGAEPKAFISLEDRAVAGNIEIAYSVYVSDPLSLSNQYLVRAFYENELIFEDAWMEGKSTEGVISGWYDGEICFELYSDINGDLRLAGKQSIIVSAPELPPNPSFTMDAEAVLAGMNKFEVGYSITDVHERLRINKAVFLVRYGGGEYEETVILPKANEGLSVAVVIPAGVTEFTLQPTLFLSTQTGQEWQLELQSQAYTAAYQISLAQTTVGVADQYDGTRMLSLNFHAHLPENAVIEVKNPLDSVVEAYDGIYYETFPTDGGEYSYQAKDADGNILTEAQFTTVTLPENLPTTMDYTFNYLNSGNILETYNDDGTINLYGDFNFSTENENIYYEIVFSGGPIYRSRQRGLVLEGIENQEYGVVYSVIFEQDGVRYELMNTPVSGTTGQAIYDQPSMTVADGKLTLVLSQYIDHGEMVDLIFNDTERVSIAVSDFAVNGDGNLGYVYTLPSGVTTVRLEIDATIQKDYYEQLIAGGMEIKGTIYKQIILEETV